METIEDIVKEMRNVAKMYLEGGNFSGSSFEMMSVYADRIDAAYRSQLTSGNMCTMECVSIGGELNQLHEAIKEMSGTIAENARLKAALNEAIPWACLKCTFWNSRTESCSRGSGMCTQVWKWKTILGEAAK